MILPDWKIRRLVHERAMITPFIDYHMKQSSNGKINPGLSSAGYDFTLDFAFKRVGDEVGAVDPKEPEQFVAFDRHARFLMGAGAMILGQTIETFHMPDDVMAFVYTRSTLARASNFLNVTPIEPGWRGQITLEISNIGSDPVWIYPGEGIGQIIFMQIDGRPERTYADKQGKYQNQHGVTGPIVQMGVG